MKSSPTLMVLFVAGLLLGPAPSLRAADAIDRIVASGTRAEVLGSGYGFAEGPAADAQGNVYFSDGKNDSIHFYRVGSEVERFVDDSTDANGMMFNSQGELVACEGAAYRIVAFNVATKAKRVLAHEIDGTHFNEPNDLTLDSAGGFYFTDPNYRHRGQETVIKEDAYYVSAEGRVSRVSTVCQKPNGILLTPDSKTLYLADNRGKVLYKYDVVAPGKLAGEKLWIDLGAGPDGMTLDQSGNLYVACGRVGIKVYSSSGEPVGVIGAEMGVPYASNCCFGGPDFDTLFITSADKFLGLKTKVRGVPPLPAR
jgi:gluconolactonase